jgi:hypothetical protein
LDRGIDDVETIVEVQLLKRCITKNAVISKLRGLPKCHKLKGLANEKVKMRPIVSSINCPIYKLSKYVGMTLKNAFPGEKFNINNSYLFAEFIREQIIPEDYLLVSLDVTSLFTNIPAKLVRDIVENSWDKVIEHTSLEKEIFLEIWDFCSNNNFFSFKDEIYEQIEGSGMGMSKSPIEASMVMEYVIEEALKRLDVTVGFFKVLC